MTKYREVDYEIVISGFYVFFFAGWDDGWPFHEGMAKVLQDGKFGFIDPAGEIAVPVEWNQARNFEDGVAVVEKEGRWMRIDKAGKVLE